MIASDDLKIQKNLKEFVEIISDTSSMRDKFPMKRDKNPKAEETKPKDFGESTE